MPLERLHNGYAYVTVEEKPLSTIEQTKEGNEITITVRDGEIKAKITKVTKKI